jgi:hypothetical protein
MRTSALLQHEVPGWREQLDRVADMHVVMQVTGYGTARVALYADPVTTPVGCRGKRVIAPHVLPTHLYPQPDVLTGRVGVNGATIRRHEVERRDLLAFRNLRDDDEVAAIAPAAGSARHARVDVLFRAGEDIRQLLVSHAPSLDHRVGGDISTQHIANGT